MKLKLPKVSFKIKERFIIAGVEEEILKYGSALYAAFFNKDKTKRKVYLLGNDRQEAFTFTAETYKEWVLKILAEKSYTTVKINTLSTPYKNIIFNILEKYKD